jgi:hypothetical protein
MCPIILLMNTGSTFTFPSTSFVERPISRADNLAAADLAAISACRALAVPQAARQQSELFVGHLT